jgi:hypothetical protein
MVTRIPLLLSQLLRAGSRQRHLLLRDHEQPARAGVKAQRSVPIRDHALSGGQYVSPSGNQA